MCSYDDAMKIPKRMKRLGSPGKKAFITDVLVDFWAYIIFVLVIIVFAILYTYSAKARLQQLEDVKDVTYGNYLASVYLRSPVLVGDAEMTMAELIALYDYNQTFERGEDNQRTMSEFSDVAVFFGFEDERNALGDAILEITDEFVNDNFDDDKCYVFSIHGNGFRYTRSGPACIIIRTGNLGFFVTADIELMQSHLPSLPTETYQTMISPVDPREDPILLLSIYDFERVLDLYEDDYISSYDFDRIRDEFFGGLS